MSTVRYLVEESEDAGEVEFAVGEEIWLGGVESRSAAR